MAHDTPLITTIVAAFVLAFIFGAIANRFRLPPLVGYLIAGIVCGPYSPGFVADLDLASQLSELGVILLMFGVGLHFSLKDLMSVRALAIPGALVQIAFATALGVGLAMLFGWGMGAGLVFGLALSVASTVVLLKALQDRRLIDTERGRIAVGWLIVEDLAMVLALVLIPALAPLLGGDTVPVMHDPFISLLERVAGTDFGLAGIIGVTLVKVAAFVGFMLIVGRRIIPWMLHAIAHTGNRELFRLAVLAIALGVALGAAYLFGVSLALGAFFAGMILSESELSHRAAQETLPLRDAFAVLFFVSAGMLFDPQVLVSNPLPVLATLFIIIVGKSVAAFIIVVAFRRSTSTALTISASLAQIGEFSFILAAMGVSLHILPQAGSDLILAGAILSIILNPLVFFVLERMRPKVEARVAARRGEPVPEAAAVPVEPTLTPQAEVVVEPETAVAPVASEDEVQPTRLSGHTILIGFGRVGTVVGEGLKDDGRSFLVIEDSDHRVAAARAMGMEVVVGNAASSEVLDLANVAGASTMLIAIPNAFEAGQATEQARKLNGGLDIIVRSHSDDERDYLKKLGANTVIMGEREIGLGMLAFLKGERPDLATRSDGPTEPTPEELAAKLAPSENFIAQATRPDVAVAAATAAAMVAEAGRIEPQVSVPEPPPAAAPDTPDAVSDIVAIPEVTPEIIPSESRTAEAAPEPLVIEAEAIAVREDVTPEEAEAEAETAAPEPAEAVPAGPEIAEAEPVKPETSEPEAVETPADETSPAAEPAVEPLPESVAETPSDTVIILGPPPAEEPETDKEPDEEPEPKAS